MAKKVKIIVDSANDLSKEMLAKHDIDLIPLTIVFGEEQFLDYEEIDQDLFLKKLKQSSAMPSTAAPSQAVFISKFKEYVEKGMSVIMIAMSSNGSATYNVACMAKQQLEEEAGKELDIAIFDSHTFTTGYGAVALSAAIMAENGAEFSDICDMVNKDLPKSKVLIMVSDLSYLKRGGRIKAGAAFIGGVLGVTPILTVADGLVVPLGKERGMKKAVEFLIREMQKDCPSGKMGRVWVMHCANNDAAVDLMKTIKENFEVEESYVLPLYITISTHTGPGAVMVTYLAE